jgi:hypothetical protein
MNSRRTLLAALTLLALGVIGGTASAQETGYYPYVIARGMDRQIIRNMPIENRPTRPLHFYGNTVRWLNNRQTPQLSLPRMGILQAPALPFGSGRTPIAKFFRR